MNGRNASGIEGGVLLRLGNTIAAGLRSWRRKQREWALLRELQTLDDHILKDIGYRRDELLVKLRADLELVPSAEDATEKAPAARPAAADWAVPPCEAARPSFRRIRCTSIPKLWTMAQNLIN
ncbi:DUF1127 domain-containing protein [Desulfocurvibacter africanus]|uniref:DUF1127 domain-containing protein n=1 Tax=Desulfocurvibacter africanus TaxID=873 RepID=UPI000488F1A4|nr:DUF1127 domain-containing protein [Desulfocurvibacter africanus]